MSRGLGVSVQLCVEEKQLVGGKSGSLMCISCGVIHTIGPGATYNVWRLINMGMPPTVLMVQVLYHSSKSRPPEIIVVEFVLVPLGQRR